MKRIYQTRRSAYRTFSALAVTLFLVGLLAACGDNTATPAPAATTAAATTAAATTAAATSAAAATTAAATTAASATTVAAVAGGNTTGVTDSEVVIGSFGPQSGPAASYGAIDRTIAAYFKKVNDDGGVNGRKIKFIYEDDGYSPPRSVTAVKKLVEQDKVFALVAGLGTPNNVAVMDYLVANGVPHLAPATGSSIICCQPLKKTIFALQTNYSVEGTILTRYAVDSLKAKKVAVFYQNDPFGKEGLDAIKTELKNKGLAEPTGVSYEPTDKDFSSQALKLQGSGADTLILWSIPGPTSGLLKEIEKLGWKPTTLMSAVNNDPSIFATAGTAIDGVWTASWLPDYTKTTDPKVAAYLDFMKKYAPNEVVGGFSVSGTAEAQLMVEALKRAGKNLTRESFVSALESMKDWNEGLPFKVSYSATNHQGQNAVYLQQASAKDKVFVTKSDFIQV
jgi:branched-chain amino acid transport system substrate-binding protein